MTQRCSRAAAHVSGRARPAGMVQATRVPTSHLKCLHTLQSSQARPSRMSPRCLMVVSATLQDYLNIELDSHRNQLIQLELLLTAGMFAMAIVTLVAGLFGMNLNNKHEESYSAFVIVSGCCGGCLR